MIPPILRTTTSLLMLAACSVLIAACGGDGSDAIAKTRAVAYGKLVNLRGGDVPEMRPLVSGFETNNGPPFGNCATQVDGTDKVVAVESPWFVRSRGNGHGRVLTAPRPPAEGVHSVVYVMREPSLASRNVAAAQSADAPSCVERLSVRSMPRRFIGGEPYKRELEASSLPFPLLDVAGYGLRVHGTFAAALFHHKQRSTFYEDTFGFAVGSAEIVLYVVGVERPFPSIEERRLLSLLYGRTKTHTLA
jgi:hypothetical protein